MAEKIIHSFEAGRRGKPDELDTSIANLISAHLLKTNPNARFDLRTTGTFKNDNPYVRVSGEISDFLLKQNLEAELSKIILNRYNWVNLTNVKPEDFQVEFNLKPQSYDLASNEGVGDSGIPIAVAYRNTPNRLPWERHLAVEIRDILDYALHNSGKLPEQITKLSKIKQLNGLSADGKISVEALYEGAKLDSLTKITIAAEQKETLSVEELRDKTHKIISSYLTHLEHKYNLSFGKPIIDINGIGAWIGGGWEVDDGSREAKPYRDGFSSYGVQEDSFSGEDPTKPSSTGTYIARHIAVQVVGNNLADFARVALSYTIGKEEVGLNITTNNTGRISQTHLEENIKLNLSLKVNDAIPRFDLKNHELYEQIVKDSDYFHNSTLPWNAVRPLEIK
ncbi:hypothetical protein COV11_03160 [Candidatus Woesearchaeota archaeon CG10_big_fil_rev_8_21_14_0_10_30_7]|nr:MAG: hypothetical protein COV11_03160 [Candidatus Woesearchaeota archaeon CG10_big_fil_rev_8_21_14_0_10_30_7]